MNKLLLKVGTVATGVVLTTFGVSTEAKALLIGDTVRGELFFGDNPASVDETVVVDADASEFASIDPFFVLFLDVQDDFLEVTYDLDQGEPPFTISPTRWVLSDLDWVNRPGHITDVTIVSGDESLVKNISFTKDSITIDFLSYSSPGVQEWRFDIEAQHVPTPAAILPTLFGMGAVASRKRNEQESEV